MIAPLEIPPSIPGHADSAGHTHRIQSIDGLRAIAILLVLIHHYTPWILIGNSSVSRFLLESTYWFGTGVDLFFVISGFLITGILVDSKGSSNYFGRFYWRRSLRIFPAYYTFLLPMLFAPALFTGIGRPWFIFYLRNWRGPDAASDSVLGHLWSLAVEEQFYIGWSIIVFLVAARWLPHVAAALIALAPVVRAVMGHLGYSGYEIFRVTPARMDSLLFGALVALAIRSSWKPRLSDFAIFGTIVSIAGLTAMRISSGPLNVNLALVQLVCPFCIPLLYASILALTLEARSGGRVARTLNNPFLRPVAKYSYAIYLLHLFFARIVFVIFKMIGGRFPAVSTLLDVLFIPAAFAFVYGLAVLSWHYIEAPALTLKDRMFVNSRQAQPVLG